MTANHGVPHISLVFREMWDTANLDPSLSTEQSNPFTLTITS
jgi:hypothetical protein